MSKPHHYKKIYEKKRGLRGWPIRAVKSLLLFLFLGALTGVVAVVAVFVYYTKDLPRPEKFTERTVVLPTRIYDRTGTVLLYEVFGEEKRKLVSLSEIPESLKQAVLVTEDAGFYQHVGLSMRGVARAILTNLGLRPSPIKTQGGSTITQQLARASFLTREKTASRKIRELVITLELERRYSKDQLLEFYLNQIPFGSNAYGVGSAAELYFHKEPAGLSVAESAALAALIQAPTFYSPYGPNRERLLQRKDYVVTKMEEAGFLTGQQAQEARSQELVFQDPSPAIRAPHFALYVMDLLAQTYGEEFLRENGLKVSTSLDWNLQQMAERSMQEFAERNKGLGAHNASLVAINPQTGEIVAMVGSRDWFGEPSPKNCAPGKNCLFDPKVNVATYHPGRQPGSAFKPFVYAVALQKGYTEETVIIDEETNFGVWGGKEYIPKNYDGKFRGDVTLRQALAQSLNIPSIKVLLDLAGIQASVAFAKEAGIGTLGDAASYGPALVLGGGEVRLLDMVSAYGVFAAEGKKIPPVSILKIEDARGRVLGKNTSTPIRILSPEIAKEITSILSDNEARIPVFRPNSPLVIPGHTVAVKTGTTQEYKDGWAIGYASNLVAGVWAGNNDGSPTFQEPGVALAAPIWNRFMIQALNYLSAAPTP